MLIHGSTGRVVLEAQNCRIRGSDLIESLKLDTRFVLRFVTELSWSSTSPVEPPMLSGSGYSFDEADISRSSSGSSSSIAGTGFVMGGKAAAAVAGAGHHVAVQRQQQQPGSSSNMPGESH